MLGVMVAVLLRVILWKAVDWVVTKLSPLVNRALQWLGGNCELWGQWLGGNCKLPGQWLVGKAIDRVVTKLSPLVTRGLQWLGSNCKLWGQWLGGSCKRWPWAAVAVLAFLFCCVLFRE